MPQPATRRSRPETSHELRMVSAVTGLVLCFFFLWALGRAPFVASDEPVLVDFSQFYSGARLIWSGDVEQLYDDDVLLRAVAADVPWPAVTIFPPVYPAHVYASFGPVLLVSFLPAAVSFALASLGLYALGVLLLGSGGQSDVDLRWLAFGNPALVYVIPAGQITAIPFLQLALVWRAWRAERWGMAGLCLGLMAWKPQLLLIGLVAAVVQPRVRLLGGVLAGAGIHAVVFTLVAGPSGWGGWARVLRLLAANEQVFQNRWQFQSLKGSLALWVPRGELYWWTLAAATLVVLLACWRIGRTSDHRVTFAATVLGGLLISPHVYTYDVLLASAGLYAIGQQALQRPSLARSDRAAYTIYWAPLVAGSAQFTSVPPVCAAMVAWLLFTAWERRPPHSIVDSPPEPAVNERPEPESVPLADGS